MLHADTRFGGGNKPKLPLPKPPPPNPLAHNRQPKVRFTVADDAPTVNSGGSSYQIPGGHFTVFLQVMAFPTLDVSLTCIKVQAGVGIAWWVLSQCDSGLREA